MHPAAACHPAPLPSRFGRTSAAALVLGAVACTQAPWLPPALLAWAGLLLGVLLWGARWRGRAAGALLAGLCWTALHGHWMLQQQLPSQAAPLDAQVTGRVLDLPEHHPTYSRFLLRIDDHAGLPSALRGRRVQVYWSDPFRTGAPAPADGVRTARRQLAAGSRWQLSLRLRAPRGRINPGGFDAERQALLTGIAATATVREPARARPLQPPQGLAAWREAMATRISTAVDARTAPFVQALALGDTRGLGDADWNVLRALGLTHLIAISGFHVGLVAGAVALLVGLLWRCHRGLPQWLPRPVASCWAAAAGAAGYTLVAGAALPTVRTALMIIVLALACAGRRRPAAGQALALAALATLGAAPLSVLSAGFWLSFGGVLWLLWCLPGGRMQGPAGGAVVRGFLAAQGVASVALLPLLVGLFGQASRLGPLVNLVIAPWWSLVVVPLALLGTALDAVHAGLGSGLWSLAGRAFGLSWRGLVPLAGLDGAVWWLPQAPAWAVPAALLGVFWMLLPRGHGGALAAPLLALPLLWPATGVPAHGAVELLLMDVGQGTAVLVRTARHRLLYDLGPPGSGERVVLPALHALGTGPPQRIVVSHGDSDHAGGLPAVRAAFPGVPVMAPADAAVGADVRCASGQQWRWDGVVFTVLHPDPAGRTRGNENSCVLRIDSAHGAVLLAGDIGRSAEASLLRTARSALAVQVVLVPHHGSAGSSTPDWIAAVSPRLALVSAGHGNRFGHPRAEVVQRWQRQGAEVLDTARAGALRVWLDRQGLHVREQRIHAARWWDGAARARAAVILSADKQAADGPEG